jgi:hypothetical protein
MLQGVKMAENSRCKGTCELPDCWHTEFFDTLKSGHAENMARTPDGIHGANVES